MWDAEIFSSMADADSCCVVVNGCVANTSNASSDCKTVYQNTAYVRQQYRQQHELTPREWPYMETLPAR